MIIVGLLDCVSDVDSQPFNVQTHIFIILASLYPVIPDIIHEKFLGIFQTAVKCYNIAVVRPRRDKFEGSGDFVLHQCVNFFNLSIASEYTISTYCSVV